jgi:tetratricopeptide (TPR) repeat protein
MHSRGSHVVLFYLALAGSVSTACAGTLQEYKEMDDWCVTRNKWEDAKRIGMLPPQPDRSFHYHHYCDAIRGLGDMYKSKNKQDLKFHYDFVLDNNDYVIGHVPPDHHLLPLIYLLNGKANYLMKSYSAAETNYLAASRLDPNYAPIYIALAYLYMDTKRTKDATKAVQAGLKLDATAKALRRMAGQLNIKLEPLPVTPEPASAADSTPPIASTVVAPPVTPAPIKPGSDAAPTARSELSVIGSPTNPWCRFCPDTPPASAGATPSTPGVTLHAPR